VDIPFAEEWVKTVVEDWRADDDGEGVEVVDDVVGDTVGGEHGGESVGSATESVVVDVLKGEEAEDSGSLESTANVFNELIVPWDLHRTAGLGDHGGFSRLEKSFAAEDGHEAAALDADTHDTAAFTEIGSTWWVEDETLAEVEEEEGERKVEEERKEEGQPPPDVFLGIGSWDSHETTDVDEKVEPKHDTLGGSLRVLDDSFAGWEGLDGWGCAWHLIEKCRGDTRLEHGSSNGQDVYTQKERSFGTTVCQQTWDTRNNHKNVRETTDGHTTADELEATGLSISEPSEKHRQGICQHRE